MKTFLTFALAVLLNIAASGQNNEKGWISLFDGKSLAGWKVSEHPATFTVANGTIIAFGDRAHLFYDGAVMNHNFKNFEFKAEVMTTPVGKTRRSGSRGRGNPRSSTVSAVQARPVEACA